MHNLDRVQLESWPEEMENDAFRDTEWEAGQGQYEWETVDSQSEWESWPQQGEGPFDAATEMEMAAELLNARDDQELEYFFGNLFKRVKRLARSPALRPLTGMLRNIARSALPALGTAAGSFFGGPVGGALGGKLASSAGQALGLELEGLSPEDQEFEVARSIVRLAGDAAKNLATTPPSGSPVEAAQAAIQRAARTHAPGLVGNGIRPRVGATTGRWIRRGRVIVVLGV